MNVCSVLDGYLTYQDLLSMLFHLLLYVPLRAIRQVLARVEELGFLPDEASAKNVGNNEARRVPSVEDECVPAFALVDVSHESG